MRIGRRHFIAGSLVSIPSLSSALGQAGLPGTGGSALNDTLPRPTRVFDSATVAWSDPFPNGWRRKQLFHDPATNDSIGLWKIPPGGSAGLMHYHDFHEWYLWLEGDYRKQEFESPGDLVGKSISFREGTFASFPPHALHGKAPDVAPALSQWGGIVLVGEGGGKTRSPLRSSPRFDAGYEKIRHWNRSTMVDAIDARAWAPTEPGDATSFEKRLYDSDMIGFRARLLRIGTPSKEAGPWTANHYRKAHQFFFVVSGAVGMRSATADGVIGAPSTVTSRSLIDCPPGNALELVSGGLAGEDAIVLEITYAQGTTTSPGVIERPLTKSPFGTRAA